MKSYCLAAIVMALAAGCTTTEPTAEEKLALAAYSDGYAPTGTIIKRKSVNNESNLIVFDKTALENAKQSGAASLAPPPGK